MKPILAAALLLAALPAAADQPGAPDLAWMTGCWSFEKDGLRVEEIWLAPTVDGAPGMSRALRKGRTVSTEFTKLAVGKDRRIHYIANPQGQREASFGLVELKGTRVVFENKDHDYPQRIVYQYTAPDRLDARVEGSLKGKERVEEYPFRRSPCPGQ